MDDKIRFQIRISEDTDERIKSAMPLSVCRSKNEFVEKTLRFYCEYLTAQDSAEMLPSVLVSALRSTVQNTEDRLARLLFKLTVEESMMMNVLSIGMEIDHRDLDKLRARCVQEIKRTNGSITFKDTVERRNNGEE